MKINGFRLDEQLKDTEFVTVYRATQVALDRSVLLKVIKPQFAADEKVLHRLRQEARAIAKISHPNVVHVYDFGEDQDSIYIAMEYFPSRDYEQVLQEDGPVGIEVGIQALVQVLKGLGAVHRQEIFHRDIKPANLLVDDANHVKITDFGLANLKGATGVTMEGGIVGTPRYMSPEQISGAKPSPQSELFSLGVTFYELFTGILPFEADSYSAVFNKILNKDADPAHGIREEIPEDLSRILERMMAKRTGDRYPDCAAVLEDLGHIFPGNGRGGKQDAASKIITKKESTVGRWGTLIVAAVVIAVITGLIWLRNNSEVTNIAEPEPEVSHTVSDTTQMETVKPLNDAEDDDPPPTTQQTVESPATKEESTPDNIASILNEPVSGANTPGKLWIGVSPWATVYLQNDSLGTSPMQDTLELEPGKYSVALKHPEYPEYQTDVNIRSGETVNLRVDLNRESGFLSLAVYPWAKVYIDGEFVDTTPLPSPIVMRPGRHLIQLKHPDFEDWQTYVDVSRGDTAELKVRL